MNEATARTYRDYILPPNVVTRSDVSRLLTEFERVDGELTTAIVHAKTGAAPTPTPTLSRSLTDFLVQNKLDVAKDHARSELLAQLKLLKDSVPVVHMTFAAEADQESLAELVKWLRASVHPQAVIAVGLQPGLIAGVYVRTPNHVYDLSLRSKLKGSRDLLVKQLGALHGR